jgi:hypothetical protein
MTVEQPVVSGRRTMILGTVLFVLAAYFALFERSTVRPERSDSGGSKILDCGDGRPTELSLTGPRGSISARREGEDWVTNAGGFAPVAFANLAEALCRLPVIDRIGPPVGLADFGLEPASAEIRATIGGRERRLQVGASTPAYNMMYIKFVDEPDVLKVGIELRSDVDRLSAFAGGSS